MEMKFLKLLLFKITILDLKVFMGKYKLKNDTMNESELQTEYKYNIYPRDSKLIPIRDSLKETMYL